MVTPFFAYVLAYGLLCVHGVHRGWLTAWSFAPKPAPPPPEPVDWPRVTVQIPVFNERDVVHRVVDAVAALDYPPGLLDIQVLDDSTDDTGHFAEVACARARENGVSAVVLHRSDRTGYKAGALQAGLTHTDAPCIAVFDADFVPPRDFLRRTVPWIVEGAGLVQARWGYLNVTENGLTWLQGILLDGHFVVEQPARWRSNRWMQFNGTAGVWARSAIFAGGGWEHDTLTEDLDLSYRAQMAGQRFVYLDDLVVPSELPATMSAFKAQQQRWGRGMAQALVKCFPRIVRSQGPLALKVEAFLHLSSALSWPLAAVTSAALPVALVARSAGVLVVPPAVDAAVFVGATLPIVAFYAAAAWRAGRGGLGYRLLAIPGAMALGVGLGPSQTWAVLGGLFSRAGEFVRTPKAGDALVSSYAAVKGLFWTLELGLAAWMATAVAIALWNGWPGATPFLILFAFGYAYVGLEGLREWSQPAPRARNAGVQVNHHSHQASLQVPPSESQDHNTV
jgi:cellulose synthase/poly-beta-1,6-N-acetylglucosamine synthase-like glycosyltransferase